MSGSIIAHFSIFVSTNQSSREDRNTPLLKPIAELLFSKVNAVMRMKTEVLTLQQFGTLGLVCIRVGSWPWNVGRHVIFDWPPMINLIMNNPV